MGRKKLGNKKLIVVSFRVAGGVWKQFKTKFPVKATTRIRKLIIRDLQKERVKE